MTAKVSFKVAGASKGALEAVEKAGGKVEIIVTVSAAEKAGGTVDVIEVVTAAEKAALKKGKIRLKRIEAKNEKIAANKG